MRTVYTGGTFDLFHSGHVNFLRQCKVVAGEEGIVVVALNTDKFVEEYKKSAPVVPYEGRKIVLESCRYVDKVVENEGGRDSKPSILLVQPDFIAIADDWCKKDYYTQMGFTQEWLDQNNIVLLYIPYKNGISSSTIKQLLSRRGQEV